MSPHSAPPEQLKVPSTSTTFVATRCVNDAGFTLFEVMLVLALVVMASAASTVAFRRGPQQLALQPTVALVMADLRSARVVAMQRSRVVEVQFDGPARSYVVTGAASAKRFPDNIGFVFSTNSDGLRADYANRLLFFPDGSSTGGALTLSSAGSKSDSPPRNVVLSIDWLSGTIRQLGGEAIQ
jgi:general secretion pathway protein H